MIKIIVSGQNVSGECKKIASDSIDYLRVYFSFSSDWCGLVKTAQFTQNDKTFNVLVDDGRCRVPSEISNGKVVLSVFGQMSGGTKRITTIPYEFTVERSGFVADGDVPVPPTPDLYSQLIKRVEDAVEDIPDALSGFSNDMGFITKADVPEKLSELTNDTGFITEADVPEKLSELTNDTGFITKADVPEKLSELSNDTGFITKADVPEKLSQLSNDTDFITKADVPEKLSQLTNDTDFVTKQYIDSLVGEIDAALDGIIALQEYYIEGGAV